MACRVRRRGSDYGYDGVSTWTEMTKSRPHDDKVPIRSDVTVFFFAYRVDSVLGKKTRPKFQTCCFSQGAGCSVQCSGFRLEGLPLALASLALSLTLGLSASRLHRTACGAGWTPRGACRWVQDVTWTSVSPSGAHGSFLHVHHLPAPPLSRPLAWTPSTLVTLFLTHLYVSHQPIPVDVDGSRMH